METDITLEGKIFIDTFISENSKTITNFISQTGSVKVVITYGTTHIFSFKDQTAWIDCKNGRIVFNRVIDNVYLETFLSLDTNCKGVICNKHMRRKCCYRYFINQIKSIIDKVNTETKN